MKKATFALLTLMSALSLVSCDKTTNLQYGEGVSVETGTKIDNGIDPFEGIGLYTNPELGIDGVLDEEYLFPNGSGPINVYSSETETTNLYLHKGDRAIYFYFDCDDDSISCLNLEDINLVTAQSDSCELYVDTYGSGGKRRNSNVYEFRMTAGGRVFSYLNGFVSRVFLNEGSTLNFHKDVDNGWVIEGYIAYKSLGSDVTKDTPTSFQYARVTKTANRNYVWHGYVDPQVPDNYKVLASDNLMYNLRDFPVSKKIKGQIVDASGTPLKNARANISSLGVSCYTDNEGCFELECKNVVKDLDIKFSKSGYLDYSKKITHEELRLHNGSIFDLGTYTILSSAESTYSSTVTGKVTERDGVTPLANATVKINDSQTTTDAQGNYSFTGSFDGYINTIEFEANNHISYSKDLEFRDVKINGTTEMNSVQLDENYGDEIGFGKYVTGFAKARVYREQTSFKMVLKATGDISLEGSGFEVFIDTKDSAVFNKRDETDYLFVFQYADEAVVDITNYGGKSVRPTGITASHGRINELYYVEVNLPYELIDVTKDEIVGFYFGVKVNYQWEGMYENETGNYIKAESPINYYRLDTDSRFFIGSCNYAPEAPTAYTYVGKIGDYEDNHGLIQYDVSVSRASNYLLVKLDMVDNGAKYGEYDVALHVHVDMNASKTKESFDTNNYHIEMYPPRAVSHYMKFDASKGDYSTTQYFEENSDIKYAYYYKNSVYIKLTTEVFGGESTNNFGFALGIWNAKNGSTSFVSKDGVEICDPSSPSSFVIVSPSGEVL